MNLQERIKDVRGRIVDACRRSGRRPESIRFVAVTKTLEPSTIREAYDAGLREFGENRVQECSEKKAALADLDVTWHLIGHLQSNKANLARSLFDYVHSVDSLRIAAALSAATPSSAKPLPVLLQVNLAREEQKSGVPEEEAPALAEAISHLPGVELRGLMLIPPFFDNPELARPYFSSLRLLAERIAALKLPGVLMSELSMGMSHDFEIAIEEGATIVRVGTAIFGART